jgi:zinc D-Ala-D-Ala dipeptidase
MKIGMLFAVAFLAAVSARGQGMDLVAVTSVNSHIVLDIRYATTNNFTGRRVYAVSRVFLRRATAAKLSAAQTELEQQGLGLKVFDAYRPLAVQKQFWAIMPDERYVADPAKGSRHNRGSAVDVTLVRRDAGAELPMPSGYDDFSARAHYDFTNLTADVIANRALLRNVMVRHGFAPMETEWWHFDDVDWKSYGVMDVPLEQIP